MKRSDKAAQARRELDRKFISANVEPVRARPRFGWIRAIRGALGMSQRVLAERLDITQPSVANLERSELEGGITMGKLAEVARALDCTLFYALVPNTSLEETVQRQARRVAADTLGYVGVTMELEGQAVESDRLADQLDSEKERVIAANRQWSQA